MEILEDNSPYYISFTHPGIEDVIRISTSLEVDNWQRDIPFFEVRLPLTMGRELLKYVPYSSELRLKEHRALIFISAPGYIYTAHMDCTESNFGINYPLYINDDKCVTSWYSEDIAIGREVVDRKIQNFDKSEVTPIYSYTMKMGPAILINTGIWHDFDNSLSDSPRAILTLRPWGDMSFEAAKEIMFSNKQ